MLGIWLLILKIIGWILLGLVCLFLGLLLLLMFVPVPYRFQAEFGDSFTYRLKVFGLQVYPKKERAGRKKRRRRKRKARVEGGPPKEEPSGDEASDTGKDGQEKTGAVPDAPNAKELRDEPNTSKNPSLRKSSGTEKPPNAEKKKFKKKKIKNKKFGTKKSGKKKSEKKMRKTESMDIDALRKKWELLRMELTDEGNRRAVNHGCSELAYVLRHCGPRRVKADIAYSLADPANTGYVTAVLCICPFVYRKGCEIIPDFESEEIYARGWVDVRGHVRLVHFGLSGLRLLIDRDIRAIIRKVRQ